MKIPAGRWVPGLVLAVGLAWPARSAGLAGDYALNPLPALGDMSAMTKQGANGPGHSTPPWFLVKDLHLSLDGSGTVTSGTLTVALQAVSTSSNMYHALARALGTDKPVTYAITGTVTAGRVDLTFTQADQVGGGLPAQLHDASVGTGGTTIKGTLNLYQTYEERYWKQTIPVTLTSR